MLELYRNIKCRREALGMSQMELAKKVGYTDRSSIAKIEAGKVDLPQSKIMELAAALHVSAGDLGLDGVADSGNDDSFERNKVILKVLKKNPALRGVIEKAADDVYLKKLLKWVSLMEAYEKYGE